MLPRLLLRSGHRDALAALGAATTKNFTSAARLLASAKAMGALAALVVGLVGALHGNSPDPGADRIQATGLVAEGDRYSSNVAKSRRRLRPFRWRRPRWDPYATHARTSACWTVIAFANAAIRRDLDEESLADNGNRFAAIRSSLGDVFDLRGDFRNCYQRRVSSPVDKPYGLAAGENQKPLWITSGLVVFCL